MQETQKSPRTDFDDQVERFFRGAVSWNMGRFKAGLLFGLPVLVLLVVVVYVAIMVPQPVIRFVTARADSEPVAVFEYFIFWGALLGGAWALGVALWWRFSSVVLRWGEKLLRNSKAGVIVNPIYGQIAAGDPTQLADLVWVLDPSTGRTELHVVKFDPARDSSLKLPASEEDELLVATAFRASPTDQKAHNVPRFLCLPANFTYQQYLEFPASNYQSRPPTFSAENQRIQAFKRKLHKERGLLGWHYSRDPIPE